MKKKNSRLSKLCTHPCIQKKERGNRAGVECKRVSYEKNIFNLEET